jgi:hypothetical protein
MRFGGTVYHAKRVYDENATIATFETPKPYVVRANYLSVMPASSRGYMAIMSYGEDLENTWTVIANGRAFSGVFKEGDLMWVDGESPIVDVEQEYGNGASANAIVRSVVEVNNSISITLTRNKEQVKQ